MISLLQIFVKQISKPNNGGSLTGDCSGKANSFAAQ